MKMVLFTIPWVNYPVYTYGVLVGFAFFTIWFFSPRLAVRTGNDPRVLSMAILVAVVPFLLGARFFVLWANPHIPRTLNDFLYIRGGGVVAYGGFIAALGAAFVYLRAMGANTWRLADAVSPFLILALGMVRIGCFCSGCCFGKPTDSFLGLRFPPGSIAFDQHLHFGLAEVSATGTVPLHPVQLYEAVFDGTLAVVLLTMHRRREREIRGEDLAAPPRLSGDGKDGRIFWTLTAAYAVGRFFLETVRDDRLRGTVFGVLTQSQFVGLILMGLAAFMVIYWLPRHPYRPRKPHAPA